MQDPVDAAAVAERAQGDFALVLRALEDGFYDGWGRTRTAAHGCPLTGSSPPARAISRT
jgi:hypothetical protein